MSMPANNAAADTIRAVEGALRAGDTARAIQLAHAALDARLDHPLLFNLRAHDLERAGKHREALADLRRALAMAPNDPPTLMAYGLCLEKLEQWLQAIAAFDAVIAKEPRFPPAHYHKGWCAELRGDLATAERCYRDALELKPDYAHAMSRLAGLAIQRASWGEGVSLAAAALAL